MRAESCVAVSSVWPAKKISATSMRANNRQKNSGATNANWTAALPRSLRRKRRTRWAAIRMERMGDEQNDQVWVGGAADSVAFATLVTQNGDQVQLDADPLELIFSEK